MSDGDSNSTSMTNSSVFNNLTLTKAEIYEYLESEYNKGCSGVYAGQLWFCNQNATSFAFGILACVIAGIGLIGNIASIVTIVCNKKLHKLIYVALACLLVSDLAALVSYFVGGYIVSVIVTFDYKLALLLGYSVTTTNSVSMHVILIVVLRYLLQVHPLRCQGPNAMKLLIGCSALLWIISLIFGAGFIIPVSTTIDSTDFTSLDEYQSLLEWFSDLHMYIRLYMLGLPIAVILLFGCLRRCGTSFVHVHKRVSNAISVMMFIYILASSEEIIIKVLTIILGDGFDYHLLSTTSEYLIYPVNPISWIFNYSVKPVILIFVTPPGRKFCKRLTCRRGD